MSGTPFACVRIGIPALTGDDVAAGVRSDQRRSYYRALVARGQLTGVPLDASEDTYAAIIKATGQHGQQVSLEDQDDSANSGDDMIVLFDHAAPARPAKRSAKQAPNRGAKRSKQLDWVVALCPALDGPQQFPVLTDAPALQHGQHGQQGEEVQALQDVASSSSQPYVPPDDVAYQLVPVAQHGQQRDPRVMSAHNQQILLEGATIQYEKHGHHGQPGAYERLRAKCPLHGAKCDVQRSFSTRLAARSGLGDLEPYAFVGLWLSKSNDFADRASHRAWKPEPDAVAAYAREQQWL